MRPGVATALALLLVGSSARAQRCVPSGREPSPYRPSMSRREPAAVTVPNLSVATLMAWSAPSGAQHHAGRDRDESLDEREGMVAVLEGEVWRVKVGDDGCDLRVEVAAVRAGSDSPRVTVRIPAGAAYDEARATLRAAAGTGRVDLREPVHVRLTGYVFWNGDHWCSRNEGRGCGHRADIVASLWELRPVWRVELVGGRAPGGEASEGRHRGRHGHGHGGGHGHPGRRHRRERAEE